MRFLCLLAVLAASTAAAKCLPVQYHCLCTGEAIDWVAKVEATGASAGTVRDVFPSVHPDAGVPAVGASVMFTTAGTAASSGDFVLVDNAGDGLVLVNGGQTARCANAEVPTDEYAGSVVVGTCWATLTAHGLKQPDCHDTGCGCGCGAASGPAASALILLLRRLRRPPRNF